MEIKTYFKNQKEIIISELNEAKASVKVAVAWFTNFDLFNALKNCISRKVKVELIIVNDEINNRIGGLNLQEFINSGGELYFGEDNHPMHHKFCIIDDEVLINGSFNWTYLAETINHENITVFKGINGVTDVFNLEFEQLKNSLSKQKEVIPFLEAPQRITSAFSIRNYLSNDIQVRAKTEQLKGNHQNALNLSNLAININPTNNETQKKSAEISEVAYRLWQKDYLIGKIEFEENKTIFHFRTVVENGAFVHGPLAKFAWFLRNCKDRNQEIKLIKVSDLRQNGVPVASEINSNSIVQFGMDGDVAENFDWIEQRGYKPSSLNGQFIDHNNQKVDIKSLEVKNGDVLECEIVFPRISEDLELVDLIEGKGRDDYQNHWNCFEIDLTKNRKQK